MIKRLLFAIVGRSNARKNSHRDFGRALATATSRAEDNKASISKATETLPHISGLVIKNARTRPVPAAILATWQGQTRPIIVDVDTVVGGSSRRTHSYVC